jgi:hypothetical protein
VLLAAGRAGDVNQALMDLASGICRPRRPACDTCPLETSCRAYAAGDPERYPQPQARRAQEKVAGSALVVVDGVAWTLVRRPAGEGLLAGLWEPPWVAARGEDVAAAAAARYGGCWRVGRPLGRVRHAVMHYDLALEVRLAEWEPTGMPAAAAAVAGDTPRAPRALRENTVPRASAVAEGGEGWEEARNRPPEEPAAVAPTVREAAALEVRRVPLAAAGGGLAATSLVRKVAAVARASAEEQLRLGIG